MVVKKIEREIGRGWQVLHPLKVGKIQTESSAQFYCIGVC